MLRSTLSLVKLAQSKYILANVPKIMSIQVNQIYADTYLKVDLFSSMRDRIDQQFGPSKVKFFERVRQQVEEGSGGDQLVFTEDLKNATYLVQNNPEDLELLEKMLRKYSTQNSEMRFGTFNFGPLIMRLLHHFNQPDLALKLMRDEKLETLFASVNAFLLCMNLLYRNKMDNEVMEVFELIQKRECFLIKYPHDCVTQYMASARRLNTPEAYQKAKDLVANIRKSGTTMQIRATFFLASFALNQNDPGVVLELMSTIERSGALDRSLKLKAFAQMNRPEDAVVLLRSMTNVSGDVQRVPMIYEEVLTDVRESINKKEDNKELIVEFERICDVMKERGMFRGDTIEQWFEKEIERRPFSQEERINNRIGLGNGPRRGLNMPNDYERGRETRSYDQQGGYRNNDRRGNFGSRNTDFGDRRGNFGDRNADGDRRGGFGGGGRRGGSFSSGYSQRRGLNDLANDELDEYSRDKQRFAARKRSEED